MDPPLLSGLQLLLRSATYHQRPLEDRWLHLFGTVQFVLEIFCKMMTFSMSKDELEFLKKCRVLRDKFFKFIQLFVACTKKHKENLACLCFHILQILHSPIKISLIIKNILKCHSFYLFMAVVSKPLIGICSLVNGQVYFIYYSPPDCTCTMSRA